MAAESAVRAHQMTKNFNGDTGVFDIDLSVDQGTTVGLIGPSGSGKTTTVRLLVGLLTPTSGTVEVYGERPVSFRRETRARLGYMPQDSVLYPTLSLRQNLDFAGSLFGIRRRERHKRVGALIDFLGLEGVAGRLPGESSGGEKRRIALASALVHDPQLAFLDEPTAGLDPVLRRKLWDRFDQLADSGRTLVVTTQYVGEAAYCDYVAVLAEGRVLAFDTPSGLRHRAYGGELVDVVFSAPPSVSALTYLKNVGVGPDPQLVEDSTVRVVVDDTGAAIPKILEWCIENKVKVEKAEVFSPPFDDIFVELVQKPSGGPQGAT